MIKIKTFISIIILLLLTSCASTEQLEIVKNNTNRKIILPTKIEPPELKKYSVIFEYKDEALICFDKKNSDVFNANYYRLIDYIIELEKQNKYLRNEIEINNKE